MHSGRRVGGEEPQGQTVRAECGVGAEPGSYEQPWKSLAGQQMGVHVEL